MDQTNPPEEETEQPKYRRTAIDKCFFAQKSALKVQYNQDSNAIYIGIGKKDDHNTWHWKNAKIKDTEAAEIITVIAGKTDSTSFYHSYNGNETKIWINRKDDSVHVRIEDQAKGLTPAEQHVLQIILEEAILQSSRSE